MAQPAITSPKPNRTVARVAVRRVAPKQRAGAEAVLWIVQSLPPGTNSQRHL